MPRNGFPHRPCRIDAESISNYLPGGYHPIDIGDVVTGQKQSYEIIHKLGYGGFATVWLVRSAATFYALKILRADVGQDTELEILQYIKGHAGHPNVLVLSESFQLEGPNGTHRCLVLPVLGPKVKDITLTGSLRHDICLQIAEALDFLHQIGICHGGTSIS